MLWYGPVVPSPSGDDHTRPAIAQEPSRVTVVVSDLVRHPYRTFVLSWNWKTASLSAIIRAPIFFFSTLRDGWDAVSLAVVVEALYSAAVSGCYGAFTQRLRKAQPVWLSALLITIVLPAVLLWLDYLAHLVMGTPHLMQGIVAAGVLAALSSAFNWYLMLHGNLLTGGEGRSFAEDLKQLPRRLLGFVLVGPRLLGAILTGARRAADA